MSLDLEAFAMCQIRIWDLKFEVSRLSLSATDS